MLTSFRFLATLAAAALLSVTALAQPVLSDPPAKRPAAGQQQTAPAKAQPLVLASARPAEPAAPEAPETIVLTGVVLRADGQPLPGAGVYMAGAAKQVVVTDERGAFSLPVPGGRTVAVHADYFGLGSTRVSVATPLSKPLRLTIGN